MKGANDTLYFHGLAVELSEKMRIDGWKAWTMNYRDQSPAGIAAFFYYIFSPAPFVLIPFTAFVYSLAGVFLLKTMRLIFKNSTLSFFVVFPFLFMPSSLTWLSNFHRDSYFILGFFLVIYAHTILLSAPFHIKTILVSVCCFIPGAFLVWLARPYALNIIFFLSFLSFSFFLFLNSNKPLRIALILFFLAIGSYMAFVLQEKKPEGTNQKISLPGDSISLFIRGNSKTFAEHRVAFTHITDGKSNLDTKVQFNRVSDVIVYIPRAMQISLFAPFPNTWFKKDSDLFKKVAVFEMFYLYMVYSFFFVMCLKRKPTVLFIPAIVFSLGLILFQGLIVCNVGTLYRMRYGPIMMFSTMALSYIFLFREKVRKN